MFTVNQLIGFGAGGGVVFGVLSITTSVDSSDTTSHSVSMPGNVIAGDLLVAIFSVDGSPSTITWGTFTEIFENTASGNLVIAYKKADGSEGGGTETVTTNTSEQSAHIVYRISGAIDPVTQAPEVSTGATGSNAVPDPDSLTPTGGPKDFLWIACMAHDTTAASVNGFPSGYFDNISIESSAGVGRAEAASAHLFTTASSENPGAFGLDATASWSAATIGVHPE